jgi:hypothetical protein
MVHKRFTSGLYSGCNGLSSNDLKEVKMDYVSGLKNYAMQLAQSGADEASHMVFEAALQLQQYKSHLQYFQQKVEHLQYLLDKKEETPDVREERE